MARPREYDQRRPMVTLRLPPELLNAARAEAGHRCVSATKLLEYAVTVHLSLPERRAVWLPVTGPRVQFRIPRALLKRLDDLAGDLGVARSTVAAAALSYLLGTTRDDDGPPYDWG